MEIEVLNINNTIREQIYSITEGGLWDDEDFEKIKLNFDELKRERYKLYKEIIRILYSSYYLATIYYEECFKEGDYIDELFNLNSIEEVLNIIENDEDIFFIFIEKALDFHSLSKEQKRTAILLARGTEKILFKINPLFMFDKYEYSCFINKSDVLIKHDDFHKLFDMSSTNNNYISNIDEGIFEVSITYLTSYLNDLYSEDKENYKQLILDIIEDYYLYYNYMKSNLNKDNKDLIKFIENSSVDKIVKLSMCNYQILSEILSYFVEYNIKSDEEKQEIKKFGKKNNLNSIKTKILSNKNK